MAISISEKFRGSIAGRAFRAFEITLDADRQSLSISATSLGLHNIDHAMAVLGTKTSGPTGFRMPTASGSKVEFAWATSSDASDTIQLWTVGF